MRSSGPARSVVLAAVLGLPLLAACQTAMSVEEAKKVTAEFKGAFVPPPRTIADITAVLDRHKRDRPEAVATAQAKADAPPPATTNPAALIPFYYERGQAASEMGRFGQAVADLEKARALFAQGSAAVDYDDILWELTSTTALAGEFERARGYAREGVGAISPTRAGARFKFLQVLTRLHALGGELDAAEESLRALLALLDTSRSWQIARPEWRVGWSSNATTGRATLAEVRGRFDEAAALHREALNEVLSDRVASTWPGPDVFSVRLAAALLRAGRILEAEKEARAALVLILGRRGRYHTYTANATMMLGRVILEQGRAVEAESLARATVDIYEKVGVPADSVTLAFARDQLGAALVLQERWAEALAEYEKVRPVLPSLPPGFQNHMGGGLAANWAIALLRTAQPDQTLALLGPALEQSRRLGAGDDRRGAELRGLIGAAHVQRGDCAAALGELGTAVLVLLNRGLDVDEEGVSRPARDQRLAVILEAYLAALADPRCRTLLPLGLDPAAEAFRVADVARGKTVQRALDASAARAAARTPALADLVRREQDVRQQASALYGVLANALASPGTDPKAVETLRAQIETLKRARQALTQQIEQEFPAYAQLINPRPPTVEQARASLRPGEALIATYVARERTYVWAVPKAGPVAFAAAPLDAKTLEATVTDLRRALDTDARTLGEIPAFDVAAAHRLYAALLAPVAAGWQRAESLLVAAHGPLVRLPFALLPTRSGAPGPDGTLLFEGYRTVPWLVRSHAVTVLPSVASLTTLRSTPPAPAGRRPFVGFGDPWFSQRQAERATAREAAAATAAAPATGIALAARGVPITLRNLTLERRDSSRLEVLPRLPETAEEIRAIALAMRADPSDSVFLGRQANERVVKALDLARYRVIAFATHGLVPGDLDGLTQPALALSAPEVADVDGDGLLTMEEILALRLDADWVVLSACNTAAGQGAGSESLSGLGRAFFYAGARALLASNWPVETRSARDLTVDLFRRQTVDPALSRARALQATMQAMIDEGIGRAPGSDRPAFSYAHPIFWAPFTLVGDGGR